MIFELTYPGMRLDHRPEPWEHEAEVQIYYLQQQYSLANAALIGFMHESALDRGPNDDDWDANARRRSEISDSLREKMPDPFSREAIDESNYLAELLVQRERWAEGKLPRKVMRHFEFIYARAFLQAIDMFEKLLGVLVSFEGIPDGVSDSHTRLLTAFPTVRQVRNSLQHLEERLQGKGVGKKPLDLKPIQNGEIDSQAGVLAMDNLLGTRYGCTMADGHYGEVDVSPDSMSSLQEIFQSVLDAFSWSGGKTLEPSGP